MPNVNAYGKQPYSVVVIHGGPGAAGEVKPAAVELAKKTGVIEPYQTEMSVYGQVNELKEQILHYCSTSVKLIGYSYGAWLAYIFAAEFPDLTEKIILVSSGAFDEKYNQNMLEARLSRLNTVESLEAKRLHDIITDPKSKNINEQFKRFGELISKADTYAGIPDFDEPEIIYRPDIHRAVWKEANEMRSTGRLLSIGKNIKCPVTAIHGEYDPHPLKGVEEPLGKVLKDFKMITLPKCGHTPWREKFAHEKFFEILGKELT